MSIDLFEMAFMENKKLSESDEVRANTVKKVSKALSESKINVKEKCGKDKSKKKIAANKIKFTENVDDIDIQPAEGVVIVYSDEIKPEMSKEEVEKAAEEMIGDRVCKCGICGANYIADAEDEHHCEECETDEVVFDSTDEVSESFVFTKEDLEFEDEVDEETENIVCNTTCPVCNSTEAQVEVGVIAPSDEDEESEEVEETEVEVKSEEDEKLEDSDIAESEETSETEEEVEDTEKVEEKSETDIDEGIFDKFKKKKDDKSKDDDKRQSNSDYSDSDYVVVNYVDGTYRYSSAPKSDKSAAERELKRFEDQQKGMKSNLEHELVTYGEAKRLVGYKYRRKNESIDTKPLKASEFVFRESALNHLLSKFVKENYDNIKDIKITRGMHINGELRLLGYVVTESGKRQTVAFNSVGFKLNEGSMKIKLREFGPFTESAVKDSKRVPFVLECTCHNSVILPTALKYSYKVKQKDGIYECVGRNTLRDKK